MRKNPNIRLYVILGVLITIILIPLLYYSNKSTLKELITEVNASHNNSVNTITNQNFSLVFEGSIGNSRPIVMNLENDNGKIKGSYYYKKWKTDIVLSGKIIRDSKIIFSGYDSHGEHVDNFEGEFITEDHIDGIWKSPNGKKQFSFYVKKSEKNYSYYKDNQENNNLVIEGNNIWVREWPTDGEVIMKLKHGDKCKILKKGKSEIIRGIFDYWYKIEFNGKTGWVFGSQTNKQQQDDYSIIELNDQLSNRKYYINTKHSPIAPKGKYHLLFTEPFIDYYIDDYSLTIQEKNDVFGDKVHQINTITQNGEKVIEKYMVEEKTFVYQIKGLGYLLLIDSGKGGDGMSDRSYQYEVYLFDEEGNFLPGMAGGGEDWNTNNNLDTIDKYGLDSDYFIDQRDGQRYNTIKIGNRIWMNENLNYDAGKECWVYENKPYNAEKYGRLYSWKVACDVCPNGWRLPSKNDWYDLFKNNLEGHLKPGNNNWKISNIKINWVRFQQNPHDKGFNISPGGRSFESDAFYHIDRIAYFWSSTLHKTNYADNCRLELNEYSVRSEFLHVKCGLSVRCVKDLN